MNLEGERFGRFKVEALLSRGGMGEVYRGVDELLERRVALKTISPEADITELNRVRFMREARALSRLDHPGICKIYDLLETPNQKILVLEYIEGKTLKQWVEEDKPDVSQILYVAEQICEILAMAHQQRIVHRDIKPENFMVTDDNQVKILDFGLARLMEDEQGNDRTYEQVTQYGQLVGTLRYMSPEQARGEPVTVASDIYSFGSTLYEMFCGESPYRPNQKLPSLIVDIGSANTRPANELRPELDPALVTLVSSLLELDPEKRPPAEQVHFELHRIRTKPSAHKPYSLMGLSVTGLLTLLFAAWYLTTVFMSKPEISPDRVARVAVLPVQNAVGESRYDWVSLGLLERLVSALREAPGFDMVAPELIADLTRNPAADESALLQRVSYGSGADILVQPVLKQDGDQFVLEYDVYRGKRNLGHYSVKAAGPLLLAPKMARSLAERLTLKPLDHISGISEDDFANRAFAVGWDKIRREGPGNARPYFEICVDRDPGFLQARYYLAWCYFEMGEVDKARKLAGTLFGDSQDTKHVLTRALSLSLLGSIARGQGEYLKAQSYYGSALPLVSGSGFAAERAIILHQVADLAGARGDFERAERYFQQALIIKEKLGNRLGMANTLSALGAIALEVEDYDKAANEFTRALALSRELEDPSIESMSLGNLAAIAYERGDFVGAKKHWREALVWFQDSGDLRNRLILQSNLALVAISMEDYGEAGAILSKLLPEANEMGDPEVLSLTLSVMVTFKQKQGRYEEAARFLNELEGYRTWVQKDPRIRFSYVLQAYKTGQVQEARDRLKALEGEMGRAWFEEKPERLEVYRAVQGGG